MPPRAPALTDLDVSGGSPTSVKSAWRDLITNLIYAVKTKAGEGWQRLTRELHSAAGAAGDRASWNALVNILEMLD